MAADAAGVTQDTLYRWTSGKRKNKRWEEVWKEAKLRMQKTGIAAFENLRKMSDDTAAQIYLAKVAFPDTADDQLRRQERAHQRKLELLEHEAEFAKKLQKERPPLVIQYEEVPAGEAPDLSALEDDDKEG